MTEPDDARIQEVLARLPLTDHLAGQGGSMARCSGQTFYSLQWVANFLGVTRHTIMRWRNAGKIVGARVGRRWWFRESEVARLLTDGTERAPRPQDVVGVPKGAANAE